MKPISYILLVLLFITLYISFVGIFSLFDWFREVDIETQKKKPNWGKIYSYATIPTLVITLIVFCIKAFYTSPSRSSYQFDNEDYSIASPASPVSIESLKRTYFMDTFGKTEEEMERDRPLETRKYEEYRDNIMSGEYVVDPYGLHVVNEPTIDRANRKWESRKERIINNAQDKKNKIKSNEYSKLLESIKPGGDLAREASGRFYKHARRNTENKILIDKTRENINHLKTLPQTRDIIEIIQDLENDIQYIQK